MLFVKKLIADTTKGDWDFYWKFSFGSKTYSINRPKHFLNGLNFSLETSKDSIIFPNGVEFTTSQLLELKTVVDVSLLRTVDEMIKLYGQGAELTPDQQAVVDEQEAAKVATEKEKVVKEKESKVVAKPVEKDKK